MKKSPKRLLVLNLETIRQLHVAELRVIAGGDVPNTHNCTRKFCQI